MDNLSQNTIVCSINIIHDLLSMGQGICKWNCARSIDWWLFISLSQIPVLCLNRIVTIVDFADLEYNRPYSELMLSTVPEGISHCVPGVLYPWIELCTPCMSVVGDPDCNISFIMCVYKCVGYQRKRSVISWAKHFSGLFTDVILHNFYKILIGYILHSSFNSWENWDLIISS